jgi:Putative peptidoglycan binding domain
MNTRMLMAALAASAALVAPVQAGGGNHGGGGRGGFAARSAGPGGGGGAPSFRSMPGGRFSGGSFRSMPVRSFSSNRMIYSGQRFSSGGGIRSPRTTEFRSRVISPNTGGGSLAANQFARGNNIRGNNLQRFQNGGGQFRNGFNQTRTGGGQFRNGNNVLRSGWRNHVFAQHSANWHRDWDRHRDHFFHGHRFVFFDGFWWGFDLGFYPWWPWWDYPYYGYGYGYPYGYGYNYGYGYGYNDPGVYDNQPAYDQSYSGGYDQSANSSVAAAQDKLAQEGFYHGQIDGVLGPETHHAIVRFQSSRGLRVNGELTSETLSAMGLREYANSGYSNY